MQNKKALGRVLALRPDRRDGAGARGFLLFALLTLIPAALCAQSPASQLVDTHVNQHLIDKPEGLSGSRDGLSSAPLDRPSAKLGTQVSSPEPASKSNSEGDSEASGEQTKRIFWIIPNYRAVSADAKLPPLTTKTKFRLATEDSFDYSSFLVAGALAGYGQARNSTPEFQQEASGYGRYFWHAFIDQAVGNYFTEAIVPAATREDPRYYTLGHGSFLHRSEYAISRLFITRADSGGNTFNISEIGGNLLGAGVSNLYYPSQERSLSGTLDKWGTQIGVDAVGNLLKEFWPDIRHALSRK